MGRLSVLLTTEESYPYHRRDVSTWCHALTKELSEVDFTVFAVTRHPYLAPQFEPSRNVRDIITVPCGQMDDPAEYGHHDSFPDYLRRRWSVTTRDVQQDFLPHYEHFLREVATPSHPARGLGLKLLEMHLHLRYYDYHRTMTHAAVWDTFTAVMHEAWRDTHPADPSPTLAELIEAWRSFYRLMLPLAVDVRRFDLTHSTAAGFCGLPCIVAKLRRCTPYLLTEHSVYLRAQYLKLADSSPSAFVRWCLCRLVNTIVDVNYAFADQVSPVCQDNARWEQWRGVEAERITVIYNGADPTKFGSGLREKHACPTVVSVGTISPLKGQFDLIEAAALLRRAVPGVQFGFYGSVGDEAYFRRCTELVHALGLQDTVTFGNVDDPSSVLQQADVVALASVSDAFPYAVVQAMLTEAAIVATDVGGLREALGDTGMMVPPGDPTAMAEAIAALLRSPDSCRRLGQHARERALGLFTEDRVADAYRTSYQRLTDTPDLPDFSEWSPPSNRTRPCPLRRFRERSHESLQAASRTIQGAATAWSARRSVRRTAIVDAMRIRAAPLSVPMVAKS